MTKIKIKRRSSVSGNSNVSGEFGELYVNTVDDILYVSNEANAWQEVGGHGYFVTLTTSQTLSGDKNFTGSVTVKDAHNPLASSAAASTAYVTNQISGALSTNAIGNSVLAQMPANTLKGNNTGAAANQGDLTVTEVKTMLAITASDVSDFFSTTTGALKLRLDEFQNPTATIDLNNQKIVNLGAPTGANDAARKIDVENAQNGLDFKEAARLVSTTHLATLSLSATIDGKATVDGDRVLLVAQSNAAQNGLWVVSHTGSWSRPSDWLYDPSNPILQNGSAFVFIQEGNANADSAWVCTTNGDIQVDSTATAWTPFSSGSFPGGTPVQLQYGGTGLNAANINVGDILYAGSPVGTTSWSTLSIAAAGRLLQVNSAGTAPEWTDTIDGGVFT